MNKFKELTDQMYELYESCKESGFDSPQALELTKSYCSVLFVDHAINSAKSYRDEISRYEALRRTRDRLKNREGAMSNE